MATQSTHAALFALPAGYSLGYVLSQLEDLAAADELPPVAERLRRALSAFLTDYAPPPEQAAVWGPPGHLPAALPRPPAPLAPAHPAPAPSPGPAGRAPLAPAPPGSARPVPSPRPSPAPSALPGPAPSAPLPSPAPAPSSPARPAAGGRPLGEGAR